MIAFFSATGNSLAVARIVAERTGERLFDIGSAMRDGETTIHLAPDEALGFVFPVYRWTTPPLIDRFVATMALVDEAGAPVRPAYCWAAITYGYFPGAEMRHLARRLEEAHGIALDATFHVPANANCIYVSNPPTAKRANERNVHMANCAVEVAQFVADRRATPLDGGIMPGRLLSKATGVGDKRRSTGAFNVLAERCVSCGVCESVCPTGTVSFRGGAPIWEGDQCTECLACLHRCPNEAVQYGKISLNRRRYTHPSLASA